MRSADYRKAQQNFLFAFQESDHYKKCMLVCTSKSRQTVHTDYIEKIAQTGCSSDFASLFLVK